MPLTKDRFSVSPVWSDGERSLGRMKSKQGTDRDAPADAHLKPGRQRLDCGYNQYALGVPALQVKTNDGRGGS